MSAAPTERAAQWVYTGLWRILAGWFRVPRQPPTLPAAASESVEAFGPAPEFLRYLKFLFWLLMLPMDIPVLAIWVVMLVVVPIVGLVLSPLFIFLAIAPDIVAYVAIHLRYDTTWYVLSPRSLRIRRGIWVIHETTITFENIQNVEVVQGPLQRYFGIASVHVQTAGGGGGGRRGEGPAMGAHHGLIEGVKDAPRIRDLIMSRVGLSLHAGLGDEAHPDHDGHPPAAHPPAWTPEHLAVLRQINTLCAQLAARA